MRHIKIQRRHSKGITILLINFWRRRANILQDVQVQTMFSLFNAIWKSARMERKPYIYQYQVVPMSIEHGIIVSVDEPISLGHWIAKGQYKTQVQVGELLKSAAGGLVASFVMGIRDRHLDNMLLIPHTRGELIFVPIDFGHLFGKGPTIDTNRFSIPPQLKDTFNEYWSEFVACCVDGYRELHKHKEIIIKLCQWMFTDIIEESLIANFMNESFMLGKTEEEASQEIRRLVEQAPNSWKAWLKHWCHTWGQWFK